MKPSERIKDIADGYFANYPEAIMFFLDEQAELLETHTVKEEECDCNGMHEGNCPDPRFERKEEPTTQEKKCCIYCNDNDDMGCRFTKCSCHQEKLQTSSYKVTCVRCEKSIKHSCGRV